MKDKIQKMVDACSTSRAFGTKARHNAEITAYINEFKATNGIPAKGTTEAIYCILNDMTPPKCACGGVRNFDNFETGYFTYCGNKCKAKGSAQSAMMKGVWSIPGKTDAMLAARDETMLDRYQAKSAMQVPEFKDKWRQSNGFVSTEAETEDNT
jgi:hypothetical protein